jgi:hypothetical protein
LLRFDGYSDLSERSIHIAGIRIPLHLETKNYRDFTDAKPHAEQLPKLMKDIGSDWNSVVLQERLPGS